MDNEPVEVIEYKDHTIKIYQDNYAESPDVWKDNNVFLVYSHRQFNIERDNFEPHAIFEHIKELHIRKDNDNIVPLYNDYFIYNVYAYIHSGVSLALNNKSYPFNDRFDVSTTGFVLILKTEFDNDENKAKLAAESLIETWNDYLSNNIYLYEVWEKDKELHSCGGFYGEDHEKSSLLQQAKQEIDYNVNQIKKCEAIMHI